MSNCIVVVLSDFDIECVVAYIRLDTLLKTDSDEAIRIERRVNQVLGCRTRECNLELVTFCVNKLAKCHTTLSDAFRRKVKGLVGEEVSKEERWLVFSALAVHDFKYDCERV